MAKPDLRALKTLLGTLRAHGVTDYADGSGLAIKFADQIPAHVPADVGADDTTPPELPDGILDPVAILQRINRRKAAS